MKLYDNDAYRDEFMRAVYDLMSSDDTNDRANQIIELFDAAPVINAEPAPSSEPLAIEELQKMAGEPVYDFLDDEWFVIGEINDHDIVMTDGASFGLERDSQNTAFWRFFRCRVGKSLC